MDISPNEGPRAMLDPNPTEAEQPDRFAVARQRMIESQLRARGLRDARVLAAMNNVPREAFVPQHLWSEAYADWPLPIGHGQTISQPFTVGFMAAALKLGGDEKVLEIGTGSGYGAAVLSRLSRTVHTVERVPALAGLARERLARLGFANVVVYDGDGSLGLPQAAPFDAICVTASAQSLPPTLTEQLALGGRLVIPVGDSTTGQRLLRCTQRLETVEIDDLGSFAFVPLIGKYGWEETSTPPGAT